jgi:hypothetical protein
MHMYIGSLMHQCRRAGPPPALFKLSRDPGIPHPPPIIPIEGATSAPRRWLVLLVHQEIRMTHRLSAFPRHRSFRDVGTYCMLRPLGDLGKGADAAIYTDACFTHDTG